MISNTHAALLVAAMSIVTILLRFLPFLRNTERCLIR